MREPNIARHYCGQTQPHGAHNWQTPQEYGVTTIVGTYQCAGITAEIAPGPCWDDSGVKDLRDWPYRCELQAGHAGAHECTRNGGSAVWPQEER